MVQSLPQSITLDRFLKLPDTKPASEYINGQIIQKPRQQGKHSAIQTEFSTTINSILKPRRIARAFSELRCTYPSGSRSNVYCGRTVPDVSVLT